jgi:hypothetical protein
LYRIVARDSRAVEYIGMTNDIRRRIRQHINESGLLIPDSHVLHYQVPKPGTTEQHLKDWERYKIDLHDPAQNQRAGGGGRPFKVKIYLGDGSEALEVGTSESAEDAAFRTGYFARLRGFFRGLFQSRDVGSESGDL